MPKPYTMILENGFLKMGNCKENRRWK